MFRKLWFHNAALVAVALSVLLLFAAGCGSTGHGKLEEGKFNVVTSFYPLYYLAQQIGGQQANVINLVPAGVEPHDWSPTSRDLDTTSKAQLFLYNGAGLEGWVSDFLKGLSSDTKLVTVEASQDIVKLSGSAEGGSTDIRHVDPHTWVSPKSMLTMADTVHRNFMAIDPTHKEDYEANYEALAQKLKSLDKEYTDALSGVSQKDIVTSHQAFAYLARDYGLRQVAIMGLSPDAEPTAQDLLRISKFVRAEGVRYIFYEELVSDKIAKTLAREADVSTLVLNPLEGLTPKQVSNGEDYVSVMRANLQNLVQALQ